LNRLTVVTILVFTTATLHAQTKAVSGAATVSGAAAKAEQKYKAIWEPVNVKEDLHLMSVHFVSPDEGWVAGGRDELNGGVILHTADGGATWEVQLGDPQSSDRPYNFLQFLSPTLGFAVQATGVGDHKLLRTTDGKTWSPVGTVAQHRGDYQFVSADVGFVASRDNVLRTQDAGRSWQPVYQCRVKTEINGLTREVSCEFDKLYFVDAQRGYAVSGALGGGAGSVLARTADGGATWQSEIILPGEDAREGAIHFSDNGIGRLRTINGKMFYSADNGNTWTGASGEIGGKPRIEFAGPQLGWMIRYQVMAYTANGGKSWLTRQIQFPAAVEAFSLVSPERGYAVGQHGMVYKYRIVPIEYRAPGMLAAPAMPGAAMPKP
jgi:photosystem II stability/assembly factor-like uncharacterized protein